MRPIDDVMDTAYWVAAMRAIESGRPGAAFHDPLAALLAGERGRDIERSFPNRAGISWGVALRTTAIDRLIESVVPRGIDVVVNLGAGFDTRPYRMKLPADLRWIELDFPTLIETKDRVLAREKPGCRLQRMGLDLRDGADRRRTLASLLTGSASCLLIAEGLVPYWPNEDVRNLADDCLATPSLHHWILDFDDAGPRALPRRWDTLLRAAPFRFQVDDWFGFFEDSSWRPDQVITTGAESLRLERPYPLTFPSGMLMRMLPAAMRARILAGSGAVLLRKRGGDPAVT